MKKDLTVTEIFEWYDGPILFEARDRDDAHYICMLVSVENGTDLYAVFEVKRDAMASFRDGIVDLRSLILNRNTSSWYKAAGCIDNLEESKTPIENTDFLPDDGFYYQGTPERKL